MAANGYLMSPVFVCYRPTVPVFMTSATTLGVSTIRTWSMSMVAPGGRACSTPPSSAQAAAVCLKPALHWD